MNLKPPVKPGSKILMILVILLPLSGCTTLGYYAQSVSGHLSVMVDREPIEDILAREDTPEALRDKLNLVLKARIFATDVLYLPDNDSYRSYVDLKRPYAVWNVVATPEFSVDPQQWCFLFVGCVRYRGYYAQADARVFGSELERHGKDVYVYGVSAYSTLGWFDDPTLNTIIKKKDSLLVGLIFHELAHQQIYISNATAFNEGFAVAVELAGIERWLKQNGTDQQIEDYRKHKRRQRSFLELVAATHTQLKALYASTTTPEAMRQQKAAMIESLRDKYRTLKTAWGGYNGYDRWFAKDINNAQLASVATYQDYVPTFLKLLSEHNNDLRAFYAAVEKIGDMDEEQRKQEMDQRGQGSKGSESLI